LSQIFENWPILKHPNAYVLIHEDYTRLKLSAQELTLENWKTFFANIIAVRPPKKEDNNAQALIELIQSDDSTEDSKIVLQLKLLPDLLAPKTRIRTKKIQWKPSIPECKDSIIMSTTLIADITKIQENRRKVAIDLGITLQPFIIAVGSLQDISDFFVAVDNILYKVPSILKAIDLCFKIFQVFDVKYPIESAHIWLLFQRILYTSESSSDNISPTIMETISDIMTFQDRNTLSICYCYHDTCRRSFNSFYSYKKHFFSNHFGFDKTRISHNRNSENDFYSDCTELESLNCPNLKSSDKINQSLELKFPFYELEIFSIEAFQSVVLYPQQILK
ncbi:hypothetical protein ALC62_06329, partial [Cyphomyrmex costatus]